MKKIKGAYSVAEVNRYIKNLLSKDFVLSNIMVKGEVSNFKKHSSGHMYFSLKDESSLIKCVMFKGSAMSLKFLPEDGMKVVISGYISAYERDGQYQLYADSITSDGLGDLYIAYEKLKVKLEGEGLFDIKAKTKLPFLPEKVAVVTSKTGAVIRDIMNVSLRRCPNANIRLFASAVQGEGAYLTIINAINLINKEKLADVIIIARGGGSMEDLWNFNNEELARVIFNSKIPIVSAVGHETDFTIADFVADLRAPTPSAAAELVFPDMSEVSRRLIKDRQRLEISIENMMKKLEKNLDNIKARYCFKKPSAITDKEIIRLDYLTKNFIDKTSNIIFQSEERLHRMELKIDALSPLKTLARGYCVASTSRGLVKSVLDIKKDEDFTLRLSDGTINAVKI